MDIQGSSWVEVGMLEEVFAKEVIFGNKISLMNKGPVNKAKLIQKCFRELKHPNIVLKDRL